MSLPRILSATSLFFILSACAGLPPKPMADLCTLDVKSGLAHCSKIRAKMIRQNPRIGDSYSIPISEMDRFIAVSPDGWGEIVVYIKRLKALARRMMK